jgi:hypothetical protein
VENFKSIRDTFQDTIEQRIDEEASWQEKFPEVMEVTSRFQKENFERPRTITVNGKTYTVEEFQRKNAQRVRRETFQHASRRINTPQKIRGNHVRAVHRTGNIAEKGKGCGGNSDDDGGSGSNDDPDLPGPGARAHHSSSVTSQSKRKKPKYRNRHLPRRCWRVADRGRAA